MKCFPTCLVSLLLCQSLHQQILFVRSKSSIKIEDKLNLKKESDDVEVNGSDGEVLSKMDERSRLLEESDSSHCTDDSEEDLRPRKRKRHLGPRKGKTSEDVKSESRPPSDETDKNEDEDEDDDMIGNSRKSSKRERPQKRRRRRVHLGDSPDGATDGEEQESASDSTSDSSAKKTSAGSGSDDGVGGSSKGRKRIRKIYAKANLSETTKSAEAEERERRKRLSERQKMVSFLACISFYRIEMIH